MAFSRRVALVIVWALSLVGVGVWAHAAAQEPPIVLGPPVLSGDDIGFRVLGVRGDTRIGRLVVRVDGRWVEVQFAMAAVPAGK